jgi:hypothetical protein
MSRCYGAARACIDIRERTGSLVTYADSIAEAACTVFSSISR